MAVSQRAPRSIQLYPGALRTNATLRGWSFADLASAAGVSVLTVRRADRGEGIDRRSLGAIMRALESHPIPGIAALLLGAPDPEAAET